MKRTLIIFIGFILVIGMIFVLPDLIRANRITDFQGIFEKSALYTGGKIESITDPVIQELYPNLHGLTDGEEYNYWMNEDGFVEQITAIDYTGFPDHVREDYDKEKAKTAAEEWFEKVFSDQIKEMGNEMQTVCADFTGGDFPVTVEQLYHGFNTGNKASISISGDGRLIAGSFIKSTLKKEEIDVPVKISREEAIELAKQYAEEDCLKLHGKETVLRWNEMHDLKVEFSVWEGNRYWFVNLYVPVDNSELMGNDEDRDDLFLTVKIDANDGTCASIASPYGSYKGKMEEDSHN